MKELRLRGFPQRGRWVLRRLRALTPRLVRDRARGAAAPPPRALSPPELGTDGSASAEPRAAGESAGCRLSGLAATSSAKPGDEAGLRTPAPSPLSLLAGSADPARLVRGAGLGPERKLWRGTRMEGLRTQPRAAKGSSRELGEGWLGLDWDWGTPGPRWHYTGVEGRSGG